MEEITIYVAGTSRGNPGPAAAGVYVTDATGEVVFESKASIGNATDMFAEYQAVATALEEVQKKFVEKTADITFEVKLSNEQVQKQLNAESQVLDPGLMSYFMHIHNLRVVHYPKLVFTHISNEFNNEAGRLVNEALDGV